MFSDIILEMLGLTIIISRNINFLRVTREHADILYYFGCLFLNHILSEIDPEHYKLFCVAS